MLGEHEWTAHLSQASAFGTKSQQSGVAPLPPAYLSVRRRTP